MNRRTFKIDPSFKLKSIHWASAFNYVSFFNFADSNYKYGSFPSVLAVNTSYELENTSPKSFDELKEFYQKINIPIFGYLGYDLKNTIENLTSNNLDSLDSPDMFFYEPNVILRFINDEAEILCNEDSEHIFKIINEVNIDYNSKKEFDITIKQRVAKDDYIATIKEIKNHLEEGDIYELNYCMEFYAEEVLINPLDTFLKLSDISPMPFSVFMRIKDLYLICASPERFLKKEKQKLISQPIKGTSKRGSNVMEDEVLKESLRNNPKERSENMMIVDLVRNDLARSSVPGTVKVEELFGIYSFPQVHQMISTITSELNDKTHFIDAIKNAFPMGSMTGAPKIRAMELIEKFENSKRGLFSGAVGFITKEGDFDFNVVIRSIIYSSEKKYLSFQVGSAITYDSDPEKEYEECLLKGEAIRKTLQNRISKID
jgi:para-aminobenzoate synthetase component 1